MMHYRTVERNVNPESYERNFIRTTYRGATILRKREVMDRVLYGPAEPMIGLRGEAPLKSYVPVVPAQSPIPTSAAPIAPRVASSRVHKKTSSTSRKQVEKVPKKKTVKAESLVVVVIPNAVETATMIYPTEGVAGSSVLRSRPEAAPVTFTKAEHVTEFTWARVAVGPKIPKLCVFEDLEEEVVIEEKKDEIVVEEKVEETEEKSDEIVVEEEKIIEAPVETSVENLSVIVEEAEEEESFVMVQGEESFVIVEDVEEEKEKKEEEIESFVVVASNPSPPAPVRKAHRNRFLQAPRKQNKNTKPQAIAKAGKAVRRLFGIGAAVPGLSSDPANPFA